MKIRYFHYLVLIIILLGGGAMFFATNGNTALQVVVGIVTSLSYVTWGIIHHALEGDLHAKVVIEYVLIGSIAIVLITTMLL